MAGEVRVLEAGACVLGEGLRWGDAPAAWGGECLWWVDIHSRKLFARVPDTELRAEWTLPERLGWTLQTDLPGHWLLGLQSGLALARLDPGQMHPGLAWVDRLLADRPAMRLNDAKADAQGRVWFGAMNNDDESQPEGALFRWRADDGPAVQVDAGYCVANGPAIHPDGNLLLHTDSARREIYAFDLNSATGALSGRRLWRRFAGDEGYPDGMCFDAEGGLWVAQWGGASVSRFDREGRLLRRVGLPTSHITNVCFGGAGLDRLFVTSARHNLTPGQLAGEPHAGSVFEIDALGVRGLPACRASCPEAVASAAFAG